MGGYYVKRPEVQTGKGNADFEALAEDYAAVAWLLAGRPKDHPEGQEAPSTLMVFFDSGRLKFCFSPKVGSDVAFGVIDNAGDVMGSVEAALREGRFEWKTRRR